MQNEVKMILVAVVGSQDQVQGCRLRWAEGGVVTVSGSITEKCCITLDFVFLFSCKDLLRFNN